PEKDVFYYHPDHLGSSSYISTLNGQISQHVEYIAFGEVLFEEHSSSFKSPYLFNGKELDRETNLTNFGARYLDMKTSLWLNVDPLAEKFPNFSPYAYCNNNPLRFTDPTGMAPDDIIFRGKDNKELRIVTPGEDKVVNVPFNIGSNNTIDLGLGNINPNNFVFGYTAQADVGGAVGVGAQYGGEITVANFTDSTYGDYNYVYGGGHVNKTVGGQVSISASVGGSVFVGYNDTGANVKPSSFAGQSYSYNVSADLKDVVGGGISIAGFSSVKNPFTDKGWKGISLGVNVGVGASANVGSIGRQDSQTVLFNNIQPTSQRSFTDRVTNSIAPISSSIIQATYNLLKK
ncbi:RHS repeat domain-containing protein, partial [Flavobacterium psychrophilum]